MSSLKIKAFTSALAFRYVHLDIQASVIYKEAFKHSDLAFLPCPSWTSCPKKWVSYLVFFILSLSYSFLLNILVGS